MVNAVFFDLDGTLIDTIMDLAYALGKAYEVVGYQESFSREDICRYIGNGVDKLMERSLIERGHDLSIKGKLKEAYLPLYAKYQTRSSHPFPGVTSCIDRLKEYGVKVFVYTNKPHPIAIKVLNKEFGEGYFDLIQGAEEGKPLKPDPFFVNETLEMYDIRKENAVFVGDSRPDLEVAKVSGLKSVLVKWGYSREYEALSKMTDAFVSAESELFDAIVGAI